MNRKVYSGMLAMALMGSFVAYADQDIIDKEATRSRLGVLKLGTDMMQEKHQRDLKQEAETAKTTKKVVKAMQSDMHSSVVQTDYVSTNHVSGPGYTVFPSNLLEGNSFRTVSWEEICARSGNDPANDGCRVVKTLKDLRGPNYKGE